MQNMFEVRQFGGNTATGSAEVIIYAGHVDVNCETSCSIVASRRVPARRFAREEVGKKLEGKFTTDNH
jgi:hypothetical protein